MQSAEKKVTKKKEKKKERTHHFKCCGHTDVLASVSELATHACSTLSVEGKRTPLQRSIQRVALSRTHFLILVRLGWHWRTVLLHNFVYDAIERFHLRFYKIIFETFLTNFSWPNPIKVCNSSKQCWIDDFFLSGRYLTFLFLFHSHMTNVVDWLLKVKYFCISVCLL